jgi:hypothetical protein
LRFLFFRTGRLNLAVRLGAVLNLVAPADAVGLPGERVRLGDGEVPVFRPEAASGGARAGYEALAVVGEKGLTMGIFMDTIQGIWGDEAVRLYPFPRLLSARRGLYEGLIEMDHDLYLLLDVPRALDAAREAPGEGDS